MLVRVSVAVSVIGVFLLVAAEEVMLTSEVVIAEVSLEMVGKTISVEGVVKKVFVRAENLFFEIEDETGVIQAVAFKTKERLKQGEVVIVEGKVERYKGAPEIIVRQVRRRNEYTGIVSLQKR